MSIVLPLLIVDKISYYRRFYFGDKIIILYDQVHDHTSGGEEGTVIGLFDNMYSLHEKMKTVKTRYPYHADKRKYKFIGYSFGYIDPEDSIENSFNFPVVEIINFVNQKSNPTRRGGYGCNTFAYIWLHYYNTDDKYTGDRYSNDIYDIECLQLNNPEYSYNDRKYL